MGNVTLASGATLALIAMLGHLMAILWLMAMRLQWPLVARTIYRVEVKPNQLKREWRNSIHTPIHAVLLLAFLLIGSFSNRTVISFISTLLLATLWAEVWHYFSHRAFHNPRLHWIHAEHHRSRINTPLTALSFSFSEKLIFDVGLIGGLYLVDLFHNLNFYGIAGWFIGYLIINSFSHANFEIKSSNYLNTFGNFLTTTTYHSLHHSRYLGNFGLGTRLLDKALGTEVTDYEAVYARITEHHKPLGSIKELAKRPPANTGAH